MSSDMKHEPEKQPDKFGDEYSFLQETIKEDQAKGRRLLKRGVLVVCCGLLFGAAFCLGVNLTGGYLEEPRMDIPEDELSVAREDRAAFGDSAPGISGEAGSADGSISTSQKEVGAKGMASGDSSDVIEEKNEELELNSDNYIAMYSKTRKICARIEKSLVDIKGYEDTGNEEASIETGGCILSVSGRKLFILTCGNLKDMKRIDVEFFGGQIVDASVYAEYNVMDLVVLEILRDKLDKTTERGIQSVVLGTSAGIMPGDPVLAMGNIYGFYGSVGYGTIQDVSGVISLEDGQLYRMKTDLQGVEGGNGVLTNLQGEIIGIVLPVSADEENKVSGIGISSLKKILAFLQKGEKVPYTGIMGTEVTEEAAKEQELPNGVYIQNVSAGSPAMRAGIKNGDILESVGGETVVSMEDYQQLLLKCRSGQTISIQGKRRGNEGFVDMDFKVELK